MILIRKESFFVASQLTPVHGTHSVRVVRKLLPFSMRVRNEGLCDLVMSPVCSPVSLAMRCEGKEGSFVSPCHHSLVTACLTCDC